MLTEKTIVGYQCERCEAVSPADSVFDDDKPEGYFLSIERVTEAQNHYRSEMLYLCTKECLIDYFQYGIGQSTVPWRPIGRK